VEEAKILREELNLTKLQMVNLERRLDVRDSLIWNYNRMYQLLKSDISNLELQKANDHTTIKNLEKTITLSEKAFRRQKSSAYMLGIAGIVLGVFIANY
jgi:wobble nucleotide-excising tRNase